MEKSEVKLVMSTAVVVAASDFESSALVALWRAAQWFDGGYTKAGGS